MNFEGDLPGVPGAIVRRADRLPDNLPNATKLSFRAQAAPGAFLAHMEDVARYLVRDGIAIDVAPEPDSDPLAVRLFLYGMARAALIHQRGELPLHAATLVHPQKRDRAVSICGGSGMGKSTLAAELSRRGWFLLADDLTRVTWNDGMVVAWPSRPAMRLWKDACERLGLRIEELQPVRKGLEKFFVPVPAAAEPVPLAAVIELRLGDPSIAPVAGAERFAVLTQNAVRPRYIEPLGRLSEHLQLVARIGTSVRVSALYGARRATPDALADRLEVLCG